MSDFISLVRAEAIRVDSQCVALISERQGILRKIVKVYREMTFLNSLIEYHEKYEKEK